MIILMILPIVFSLLLGYGLYIASNHKALKSLSESDYWLEKPWRWLFEFVLACTGLGVVYIARNLTSEVLWMLQLGGILLSGVAVFSRFKKNKFFLIAHLICANGGFFFVIASMWYHFNSPICVLIQAIAAGLAVIVSRKNNRDVLTWNLEFTLMFSIFLCLQYLIIVTML